jgi:hypothetical protein
MIYKQVVGIMRNRCSVCGRDTEENSCNPCSTHDLTKIKKSLTKPAPTANRNYGNRICKYCSSEFLAGIPNQKYCSPRCLSKFYKQSYTGDWSRQNENEKARRALINKLWGIKSPQDWKRLWKSAEAIACSILHSEGFANVNLLTQDYPGSPFDLRAEKNGDVCAIQVTTATTQPGFYKRLRLAEVLKLGYYVLYIRPDLKGYVIKYSKKRGAYKIFLEEVRCKVKPCP